MNCDEAQEWITALIDNELSAAERVAIEEHLGTCSQCQQLCAQERRIKLDIHRTSALITAPLALRQAVEGSSGNAIPWERAKTQVKHFLTMPLVRPVLALALGLLILYPWLFPGSAKKDIALQTLSTYAEIAAGKRALARVNDPNEIKRQLIQAVNGRFASAVGAAVNTRRSVVVCCVGISPSPLRQLWNSAPPCSGASARRASAGGGPPRGGQHGGRPRDR